MSTKIGIIGSNSLVGSRFCQLSKHDFDLIEADHNGTIPIDITNKKSVESFFNSYEFDYAILFSAFTDVDAAQKQNGQKDAQAWQINVEGSSIVAEMASKTNRKIIFISTETVFDGTQGPYTEEDEYGPDMNRMSWYGITKMEAEKIIKKDSENLIIRIAYPIRANYQEKDDFAQKILRAARENNLYPMFVDQIFTPTFVDDLTPSVKLLIDEKRSGIYHVSSPETTTPFEFAEFLLKTFDIDKSLEKASIEDFLKNADSAPRPIKGGLKIEKIKKLGFTPTDWRNAILKIKEQTN